MGTAIRFFNQALFIFFIWQAIVSGLICLDRALFSRLSEENFLCQPLFAAKQVPSAAGSPCQDRERGYLQDKVQGDQLARRSRPAFL